MGLFQYHIDPYQQCFNAKVISCDPSSTPAPSNRGATDKKDKKEKKGKPAPLFDVVLEDTILFPEGGGQPTDTGTLNGLPVSHVFRDAQGRVVHHVESALEVGAEVEIKVNWARRYDHMQQHTAQHCISAIARQLYGAKTTSWWLSGEGECNIELDVSEVTPEQCVAIQEGVNQVICSALHVPVHVFATRAEAEAVPHFQANPLPPDLDFKYPLRVVDIPGLDFNKCCGTHLRNTAELRMIYITKADTYKGQGRLHFLAGERAWRASAEAMAVQRQLSGLLAAGPDRHVGLLQKLQADGKAAQGRVKTLSKEVAALAGRELIERLLTLPSIRATTAAGRPFTLVVEERVAGDADLLPLLADAFQPLARAHLPELAPCLLLLTAPKVPGGKDGALLLDGDADVVKEVTPQVLELLQGRGGGRPGRSQGNVNRLDLCSKVRDLLLVGGTEQAAPASAKAPAGAHAPEVPIAAPNGSALALVDSLLKAL